MFTPQQQQGGAAPRLGVKLGNWQEDKILAEEKAKLAGRGDGPLGYTPGASLSGSTKAILGKVHNHNMPTTLTPQHPDQRLRFGDTVMLECAATDAFLSCDTDDRSSEIPSLKVRVTTFPAKSPTVRNTFVVERPPRGKAHPDEKLWEAAGTSDCLHYGEQFRLRLHEDAQIPKDAQGPLYLQSQPIASGASKPSKLQEVSLTDRGSNTLLWTVDFWDVSRRVEMDGEPVVSNCPCLIKHVMTQQPLGSHKVIWINDFGHEYEVGCSHFEALATKHKKSQETEQNQWAFITGS